MEGDDENSMYSIMIIDDDESIGNMEQELLEREGYLIQRAYSGTEALLLLQQKRPDLILLDLMLPGMSGEKLLSMIREIPIIVVSAKTDADSKANLLLGGAVDYLTKPFDTKELLARINIRLREFIDGGHLLKEMSAEELEKHCRKCIRAEVSSTKTLACVLDAMKLEYHIVNEHTVDIFAELSITKLVETLAGSNCEIYSLKDCEESLESFYMNLVGGGKHA